MQNITLKTLTNALDLELATQQADTEKGNPILVLGAVGVGKSTVQVDWARANDCEPIVINLTDYLPSEVAGWITEKDGKAIQLTPAWATRLFDAVEQNKKVVIIFEEFPQADEDVQKATSQIIHDQRVAGRSFAGGNVFIIANGNRREDKAGANRIPQHIIDRFSIYHVDADFDTFKDYAIANDVAPEVVAFLNWHPELLHDASEKDGTSFPTPRSWVKVSNVVKIAIDKAVDETVLHASVIGRIGVGVGTQFTGFLKIFHGLPVNPTEVFADPSSAVVPEEADVLFALLGSLSYQVKKETLGAFVEYIKRVPREFAVVAGSDAFRRDPDLKKSKDAVAFYEHFKDVFVKQ